MAGRMTVSSAEKDGCPDQVIEIIVPIRLTYHEDYKVGRMQLKLAGISISQKDVEIGSIDSFAVGAGVVINLTKHSPLGKSQNWTLNGKDVWNALMIALEQEGMVLP